MDENDEIGKFRLVGRKIVDQTIPSCERAGMSRGAAITAVVSGAVAAASEDLPEKDVAAWLRALAAALESGEPPPTLN